MFDLSALAEFSEIDAARDRRQALAEESCARGMALMGLAEAEGYIDRAQVSDACELLMDAIQLSRSFVAPYIQLARAFLVFQDDQRALKYLKAAQEFAPDHPDILAYLTFLQQETSRKAQAAREGRGQPEQDFSLLLNALDGRIQSLKDAALQHMSDLQATGTLASEREVDAMIDDCDRVADQLDALEQKQIDITTLENRYEDLVLIINRIQSWIKLESSPNPPS